jgi:hypothetical protein
MQTFRVFIYVLLRRKASILDFVRSHLERNRSLCNNSRLLDTPTILENTNPEGPYDPSDEQRFLYRRQPSFSSFRRDILSLGFRYYVGGRPSSSERLYRTSAMQDMLLVLYSTVAGILTACDSLPSAPIQLVPNSTMAGGLNNYHNPSVLL